MSHKPTALDASTDLRRSIYSSFSKKSLDSKSSKFFIANAEHIIKSNRDKIDKTRLLIVKNLIREAKNDELKNNERRENLLTAAILLQNSA